MNEIIITPLGTVSPYSKNNMNCPGFLVEYGEEKILLDCGNGITRLLNFPNVLDNLNVIITHYHKDHFGDIGAIQYASYVYHNRGIINKKINIFLPKNDFEYNKQSIISNDACYADYYDITDESNYYVNDMNIIFKDNKSHNIESYMVKLQNNNFKIIYTSDIGIININDLITFCKDADIIICESSLLQEYQMNNRGHMSAYYAGIVASKANAGKLLLTHFWPEESKKTYLDEARKSFDNVMIAEEGKKLILRR